MSSQANPNPQHEPTMEEILASIRKIISEDQPAEGAKPGPKLAAVKPQPAAEPAKPRVVVAAPVAPPAPSAELDVLDLTEEIPDDDDPAQPVAIMPAAPALGPVQPVALASVLPQPPVEDDVIFQTIDAAPIVQEHPMDDDDLISDATRSAMGRAFANLNGQAPQVTLKAGSIESLFADAVQQAFRPALREWIDDHSSDVMDQLRPLIRAWMDEHLPPLIEAAVIKEISRAAQRAQKPPAARVGNS